MLRKQHYNDGGSPEMKMNSNAKYQSICHFVQPQIRPYWMVNIFYIQAKWRKGSDKEKAEADVKKKGTLKTQ